MQTSLGGANRQVTLLAATKTVPPEVINYAIDSLGITDIGENRVQELLDKYDALHLDNARLHFIGSLQTNKVKYIVDKVCMIHSVDSEKLALEIDRQARKHGIIMDVLIEVNIGREENKGGVMPEDVEALADKINELDGLRLCGMMTIAPKCGEKSEYFKYFDKTYQIFIDILQKKLHNINIPVLSMGMSDSYEEAIACGSNMIRVGSSIFGARSYS
ncbi:MAG: YggS family pyridoxal phosphate-dependent enzyme [Clostridia bacterium]|nr:YggS family pyridoxal phosphate-dependent enzyme [Clostridia bacterium]